MEKNLTTGSIGQSVAYLTVCFIGIPFITAYSVPGVYLTSRLFPATLFPMGLATATGSLLSVIICLIAFALTWPKAVNTQMEDRV